MTLSQAQALYAEVLSLKQTYETLVAQNPGVVQGAPGTVGQALQSITNQAASIRSQLAAGGYADAANVLLSDDYQNALAWAQQNPSLGTSAGSGAASSGQGTVPLSYSNGGGTGSASTPQPTGGSSPGVLSSAMSFLSGLVSDLNGFVRILLNPGQWFASVGQGVSSAEVAVGQGFSGGATAASGGASTLWQALAWPAVILASLYAVDRIAKGKSRRAR